MGILRRYIGKHTDDALAAQCQKRDDLVIVAGVNVQVVATEFGDFRYLGDVAAGFLDSVDVRQLCQLRMRY